MFKLCTVVVLPVTDLCFASVVPNRKLLSAQLSKTLVNRCLFNKVVIIFKIFLKTLVYVKISCIFTP